MQLGGAGGVQPLPTHIAAALGSSAAGLGHRPAVTVLHPTARYEQSGVSLANWAVKGAHLLELDHLVGVGSTVGLLAPPCWTTASVALATWWLGGVVSLLPDDDRATVTVAHPTTLARTGATGADLLVGDRLDGAPDPEPTAPARPAWTHEAQPLPDHPPATQAAGELPALRTAERSWSQAALLSAATELGAGTAGVEAGVTSTVTALLAITLRPLVTGHATVVLRGVDRGAAAAEKVTVWL